MSFSPINQVLEQGKLLEWRRKFSEIKVQKNTSSKVRNRLKFAKIARKDLLCMKM